VHSRTLLLYTHKAETESDFPHAEENFCAEEERALIDRLRLKVPSDPSENAASGLPIIRSESTGGLGSVLTGTSHVENGGLDAGKLDKTAGHVPQNGIGSPRRP
jgi:hypothetical protein